jgi:hypothetical protein
VRAAPCGDVAQPEAGVMVRAADEAHGERAGRPAVRAESFDAEDLGQPVQPLDPRAHGAFGRRGVAATRIHHRGHDLGVAGAAAEDARNRLFHLRSGGHGRRAQKRLGRDQHSRCADAALRRAVAEEGALQPPRHAWLGGQRRDRLDRSALGPGGGHETGAHGCAVDHDGAGAAIARVAADLDALAPKGIAQGGAEPGRGGDLRLPRGSVERECQGDPVAGVGGKGGRDPVHGCPLAMQRASARRTRTGTASSR